MLSPSPPRSIASQELDTSVGVSGPHDFAVRNSRARLALRRVHRIPHPTFVTIAKRPSLRGAGWRELVALICPTAKAKYFSQTGWTTHPDGQVVPRVADDEKPRHYFNEKGRSNAAALSPGRVCRYCVQTFMVFMPVSASVFVLNVPLSTIVVVVVVGLVSTTVHFLVALSCTT